MASREQQARGRTAPATAGAADGRPLDLHLAVRGVGLAAGVAGLGALAVALAPLLPVVGPATARAGGASLPAAVAVAVLVLALPVLAGVLLRGGHVVASARVLAGGGAAALALAVADLQLLGGALDANRFELVVPRTAAALGAGAGSVLVLVGHLLLALAAVLGVLAVRRSGVADDPEATGSDGGVPVLRAAAAPVVLVVVLAAVVAAVALFLAPLTSADPVLVVPAVVASPWPLAVAAVLLAVVLLVATALGLVTTSAVGASGALVGVALVVGTVPVSRLLAALAAPDLGVGVGSVLGTAALLALGVGAPALRSSARRREDAGRTGAADVQARLPGSVVLHRVTAVAGLACGVVAVVAALLPLVSTSDGVEVPVVEQSRVLLLAGVLLAALCAGMVGELAGLLRPAAALVVLAVLLGAGAVLQAVLVATEVTGVGWAAGAVLTVVAGLLALGCGVSAVLAGAAERDDVDLSEAVEEPVRPVAVLLVVTGLAAALGLVLPLYTAPGFTAPGLLSGAPFSGAWGWDTWSLVLVGPGLALGVAVAARARAARVVPLLAGVGTVLVVHLAAWPLTSGRVPGATFGPGAVLTALAIVLVASAAVTLGRRGAART